MAIRESWIGSGGYKHHKCTSDLRRLGEGLFRPVIVSKTLGAPADRAAPEVEKQGDDLGQQRQGINS